MEGEWTSVTYGEKFKILFTGDSIFYISDGKIENQNFYHMIDYDSTILIGNTYLLEIEFSKTDVNIFTFRNFFPADSEESAYFFESEYFRKTSTVKTAGLLVPKKENVIAAEFPGGKDKFQLYFYDKLVAAGYNNNMYEDELFVKFSLDTNGNVFNVRVVEPIERCPKCSEITISIIKSMPAWVPAYETDSTGGKLNPIIWEDGLLITF